VVTAALSAGQPGLGAPIGGVSGAAFGASAFSAPRQASLVRPVVFGLVAKPRFRWDASLTYHRGHRTTRTR